MHVFFLAEISPEKCPFLAYLKKNKTDPHAVIFFSFFGPSQKKIKQTRMRVFIFLAIPSNLAAQMCTIYHVSMASSLI